MSQGGRGRRHTSTGYSTVADIALQTELKFAYGSTKTNRSCTSFVAGFTLVWHVYHAPFSPWSQPHNNYVKIPPCAKHLVFAFIAAHTPSFCTLSGCTSRRDSSVYQAGWISGRFKSSIECSCLVSLYVKILHPCIISRTCIVFVSIYPPSYQS